MRREEKSDLISALQSSLQDANGVFVVENHGLTVREMEILRNELRPLVSVFKVVKNRLMKLALKDTNFEPVSDMLKRPTAVAVATDALAVTKVLAKFADEHPNLTIIGGKMDADVLGVDDILQLSKLPSLLEIRGKIARILVEPASRTVGNSWQNRAYFGRTCIAPGTCFSRVWKKELKQTRTAMF